MEGAKDAPFRVEKSDELGRYLVASRDLGAGEMILKESPLAVGPRGDSAPMCLSCYRPLPLLQPTARCPRCGVVPLCYPQCQRFDGHSERECEYLKARGAPPGLVDSAQVVLPLRCLLLRPGPDQQSREWGALRDMEAHVAVRRGTAVWRSHEAAVFKALHDAGLVGDDDGDLVQKVCGVLDVNCFEVRAPGSPGSSEAHRLRAVYPRAAMMAHDCVGNTHLAVDDGFVLAVHASLPIPEGGTIFFNYTNTLQALHDAGLVGDDDGDLVQKVCGVLDVNCFEVRAPGSPGSSEAHRLRAVYPRAAMMAHDCVGNTHLAVDDGFVLAVHASLPIPEGGTIFFNYTNTLQATNDRREHLKEGKYFECRCTRCNDPTELGTHLSSLRCHRCKGRGFVSPADPLDQASPWRCGGCGGSYHPGLVRTATARALDLVDRVDRGNTRDMETLLSRLSRSFAPNHAALLELKQSLVAAYRDVPSPGRKVLSRKIELCRDIIPVVKILEPGISRLAGIALYELQGPLAQLASKHFQGGDIDSDELLARLSEAEACLREALAHLVYEPPGSPEGALARAAMQELRALRESVREVEHAQRHASALMAARSGRPGGRRRHNK